MKKVEAIIRPERLQEVQDALDDLGVSGLTVTEVKGCGRQKGYTEQYRGSRVNISLLPKLKVESVVSNEVVDKAVDAIVGAAYTGEIGDGRLLNTSPHPVLKEVHSCEVAGRTLEAANVHALGAKVEGMLAQLAPGGALPVCYFRAPAMDYELPVYEERGDFVSPVIGGPNLR